MIRISNIRYSVTESEEWLFDKVKTEYALKGIKSINISKKSIDARRKNDVHYIYSIDVCCDNEKSVVKKFKNAQFFEKKFYKFPVTSENNESIVIVGFGPAGMLCALTLLKNGCKNVTVIERGKRVEERKKDVENLLENGILDENSNVQFGEGGAGTFSDGKLTTGINDERISMVLYEFCKHGAPEEILYLSKPHIGTDNLYHMVKNIREEVISLGGKIKFSSTLTDIEISDGQVSAAILNSEERIETNHIVLAIGHSARDTFSMLKEKGVKMEQKTFSVGVRIEHKQDKINDAQYGEFSKYLGAADYKLNVHLESGRGVYTFCMCPGGEVIASASEKGGVVTNGMSRFKRDKENANSAVLVNVYPSDFNSEDVLAGMYFQREIERKAYEAAGGNYSAVCETVGHLMGGENKTDIIPTYRPGVVFGSIYDVLPEFVADSIKEALPKFNEKLKCFSDTNALMTAPETRSSSPVRIIRDKERLISNIKGLYPCGEGAGYAGGITSAAVDGIRVAEAVAKSIVSGDKNIK